MENRKHIASPPIPALSLWWFSIAFAVLVAALSLAAPAVALSCRQLQFLWGARVRELGI
jgi:hypothetical protein